MQSTYYSIRFSGLWSEEFSYLHSRSGNLIGAIMGSLISNKENWGWGLTFKEVLLLSGCVPLLLVCPFIFR
jgi:hypothetical protein